MNRKTLDQVDDNLRMIDEEDPSTEPMLAKKIVLSGNNGKLKKIKRGHSHSHSSNLKNIKPPKINPETESFEQLQKNTSFITTNKRCLTFSQNFVKKAISTLSNLVKSTLKASNDDNGVSLDHVNLVKACISTITLLNRVLAEFSKKIPNNLSSIVHTAFLGL